MSVKSSLETEHTAMAKGLNLPISPKQSVELSKCLRYKNTSYATKFLQEVIDMQRAVPFPTFNKDMGHKPGMAAGRYPQKAAREFLRLIKAVEANAQVKGFDTTVLKITKIVANKASTPQTGGRKRHAKKRTHVEIMVMEDAKKASKKNLSSKKTESESKKISRTNLKNVRQGEAI